MCIIIAKQVGSTVPIEHIETAAQTNQDGIGISYKRADGKIGIKKYMNLEAFLADWQGSLGDPSTELVIHLRIATHGSVNINNVHPFRTAQGHALHHNGILSDIKCQGDKTDSETFTRQVIDPINAKDLPTQAILQGLEKQIAGSKMAIHTPDGILILNEKNGHWNNDVWYSNHGYERFDTGWSDSIAFPYSLRDSADWTEWDSECAMEDITAILPDHNPQAKQRILDEISNYLVAAEWTTVFGTDSIVGV